MLRAKPLQAQAEYNNKWQNTIDSFKMMNKEPKIIPDEPRDLDSSVRVVVVHRVAQDFSPNK